MNKAIDIMARTAWGEARGEGLTGMRSVCHVIMNRAEQGGWWGNSVVTVALKPEQFSAWNEGDPNRNKMLAVDDSNPDFAAALSIAANVYEGKLPDNTGGATHYHTKTVNPFWAEPDKVVADIGNHIFYRGIA
ncbi:cell wall hydrolase [Kordiimonas aquimaris]|uniref:cell wall hydrolase n=1 Tax=Kordiimonas aquimaris TaxID=707591 RepID=UPI0021CFDF0D|nr:cell wall hydrolase [Kordiimonas aquimaris]